MERYRFLVENANSREASRSPIAFFVPIVSIVFCNSIVSNSHIFLLHIFFLSTKLQNVVRFVRLMRIENYTYRGILLYCRSNGNCYDEFDVQWESDVWKSCFVLKNVDKSPVVNKTWPPHRRCSNFLYGDANESMLMPLLNIFSNSRWRILRYSRRD